DTLPFRLRFGLEGRIHGGIEQNLHSSLQRSHAHTVACACQKEVTSTSGVPHSTRRRSAAGLARGEPLQVGDVCGFEFVEGGDAEEAHGTEELGGEDLDGAVDSGASSGHEAVEVGASDKS